MAPWSVFLVFLLACRVSAGSCAQKPCGSEYAVTSWNPIREQGKNVYYYAVTTGGCGASFTDILLRMDPLTCEGCATIKCYNSQWKVVQCPSGGSWTKSNSFFKSVISPASGHQWDFSSRTTFRWSLSVDPARSTTQKSRLYVKGGTWTYCNVIIPVCNCNNTCPPCPSKCYKPNPNVCGCNNCTDCVNGQYEVTPCNATSNRVCAPCRDCVLNQTYEVVSCSQTSNRVCRNCTVCRNGQYMKAPCSATSDTTCQNCTQCIEGEIEVSPCDATHDRVCQPSGRNCTECVDNMTYETVPCNATQDRVCEECSQCVDNMTYETVACSVTQNRICENCTQCIGETYETVPCNVTHDRVCGGCEQCVDGDTYETVPCGSVQDRVCENCTQCVTGTTYESVPCNVTNNRVCEDCSQCVDSETYETVPCSQAQDRVCENCTQCVMGETYESVPCNTTTDRICEDCTDCVNGFFEVVPCNLTNDRVCQACSNCSTNEQVQFPCNATHDVVCVPCPECANCTDPNSHLSNNGLNCTCNDGFSQNGEGTCEAAPCCQDCQSCGFNASVPCFLNDPSQCDYSCKLSSQCTLTTPFDTGYTIDYAGTTQDTACCGAGVDCSCFQYQIGSGSADHNLEDFILGLSCPLQLCSDLSSPPCIQSVTRDDQVDPITFFVLSDPDFYTQLRGIYVPALGLRQSAVTLTFTFQGHLNESLLPIAYSATAPASSTSEDRACLVSSTTGPDCLDCSA